MDTKKAVVIVLFLLVMLSLGQFGMAFLVGDGTAAGLLVMTPLFIVATLILVVALHYWRD